MDGEEATLLFVLGLVLGVLICICYNFGEGISENTLDNVCYELTGNPDAYFISKFAFQYEFPCRVDDKILIFGKKSETSETFSDIGCTIEKNDDGTYTFDARFIVNPEHPMIQMDRCILLLNSTGE